MLKSLFTDHPASVDETYVQHLVQAGRFGLRMVGAGIACLIHALLPFLFVRTGSSAIADLHDRMVVNRRRQTGAPVGAKPGAEARLANEL